MLLTLRRKPFPMSFCWELLKQVKNPHYLFIFLLTISVISLIRKRYAYNAVDTITSLSFGLVQFLIDLLLRFLLNIPYVYIFTHWRLFSIPADSMVTYIFLLLGVDLAYYWMHRTAHEYHTLWIGHSVHHSGEYYNLATALRQGIIQSFYSKLFHLPLAFIGFPCGAWVAHNQLNTLYQFWIHTEQVGKLGILELVFNTPSHHRMHHRPPGNCNYAGFLIIWDRLFGTFREEFEMKDFYGLAQQLRSNNPLFANFAHVRRMFNISLEEIDQIRDGTMTGHVRYLYHLLCVLFKRRVIHPHLLTFADFTHLPKPLPSTYGGPPPDRIRYGSTPEEQISSLALTYVTVSFVATMLFGIRLLVTFKSITYDSLLLQISLCVFSLTCIGLLTEKNEKYLGLCESVRVFACCLFLLIHSSFPILESCDGNLFLSNATASVLIAPWNEAMSQCIYRHGFNLQSSFMIPFTIPREMCFGIAWVMLMVWAYLYQTELSPAQIRRQREIKKVE
jgi:sterol desaturase/sphingolipid hydroxylase (fatty acid hydroxylase superfamily)